MGNIKIPKQDSAVETLQPVNIRCTARVYFTSPTAVNVLPDLIPTGGDSGGDVSASGDDNDLDDWEVL